MIVNTFFVLPP